jgi:hypothetical protein
MSQALAKVDRFVLGAADQMTRRRMFRRGGGLAMTTAFGAAFLGSRTEGALANHGPICRNSIRCASDRCQSNGHCDNDLRTKPGGYNRFNCFYSGGGFTQCWTEQHNCLWVCCDCCVDYNTGFGQCANCPGIMHACICRDQRC